MLTNAYDYNLHAPNDDAFHLIAYEWQLIPADDADKQIAPEIEWVGGHNYHNEYKLVLPIAEYSQTIEYLIALFEGEQDDWFRDTLRQWHNRDPQDKDTTYFTDYDIFYGDYTGITNPNTPAVVRDWVLSLPEYDDGAPIDYAKKIAQ